MKSIYYYQKNMKERKDAFLTPLRKHRTVGPLPQARNVPSYPNSVKSQTFASIPYLCTITDSAFSPNSVKSQTSACSPLCEGIDICFHLCEVTIIFFHSPIPMKSQITAFITILVKTKTSATIPHQCEVIDPCVHLPSRWSH